MRRETRDMPVFLLKVAKDGAKFNEYVWDPRWFFTDENGVVRQPGPDFDPAPNGMASTRASGVVEGHKVTMAQLINSLNATLGRMVLDKTGLTGKYDFQVKPAVEPPSVPQGTAHVPEVPNPALLIEAVKKIGLELEKAAAPVDVWVIERAERPSEN